MPISDPAHQRNWDTKSFIARLLEHQRANNSILGVGLDPKDDHIPECYGNSANLANWKQYLFDVIAIAKTYAAIIKPESAFYERVVRLGGMDLLFDIQQEVRRLDMLGLLDAKRQDVGNTDLCYADWILRNPDLKPKIGFGFHACTRNIYLGDTFMPYYEEGKKPEENWWPYMLEGAMPVLMLKTSNKQAPWMQDLKLEDGRLVYEWVADTVCALDYDVAERSNGVASIGVVIGATYPEQALECRRRAPDVFALVPGYGGGQGGTAVDAVKAFPVKGLPLGAVCSSRGITKAWVGPDGKAKPGNPLNYVEEAMSNSRDELTEALTAHRNGVSPYAA